MRAVSSGRGRMVPLRVRQRGLADGVSRRRGRHGKPFALGLTGLADGTYASDPDAPDAQHCCWAAVNSAYSRPLCT